MEHSKRAEQLRKMEIKRADYMKTEKAKKEVEKLESRMMVSSQSIESTSDEIVKLREEELYPQLVELVKGLVSFECLIAHFIGVQKDQNAPITETTHFMFMQINGHVEKFIRKPPSPNAHSPTTQVPPHHPINGPHLRDPPPGCPPAGARGPTMAHILLQPHKKSTRLRPFFDWLA